MDSKSHISRKKAQEIVTSISEQFGLTTYKKWMQFMGRELRYNGKSILSFEEAKKFAQSLGLKTAKEWSEYCLKFRRNFVISP